VRHHNGAKETVIERPASQVGGLNRKPTPEGKCDFGIRKASKKVVAGTRAITATMVDVGLAEMEVGATTFAEPGSWSPPTGWAKSGGREETRLYGKSAGRHSGRRRQATNSATRRSG